MISHAILNISIPLWLRLRVIIRTLHAKCHPKLNKFNLRTMNSRCSSLGVESLWDDVNVKCWCNLHYAIASLELSSDSWILNHFETLGIALMRRVQASSKIHTEPNSLFFGIWQLFLKLLLAPLCKVLCSLLAGSASYTSISCGVLSPFPYTPEESGVGMSAAGIMRTF